MGVEERERDIENIKKVYEVVNSCPGIDFRDLQARSKLNKGDFHMCIDKLKEHDAISQEKEGSDIRFFASEGLTEREKKVLSLLRQFVVRKIVFYLLEHPNGKLAEIARESHISKNSLSWHLKKLSAVEVITSKKRGWNTYFSISDPNLVIKPLIVYKESFLDKLVNKFIETWTER